MTGFGPFPGAPDNPTADLVRGLARIDPAALGAGGLATLVLPTDYRKSWQRLRRLYRRFDPEVVVHFGLSAKAQAIVVERRATKRVHVDRPDVAGYAPPSGLARRSGPDMLHSTLPTDAIVAALTDAGHAAEASDDAGGYVCNATLYRSLHAADGTRLVGFVHVPPRGRGGFEPPALAAAAMVILRTVSSD